MLKFGLTRDPALMLLGRIIHAADITTDAGNATEAREPRRSRLGFRLLHGRDDPGSSSSETARCTTRSTPGPRHEGRPPSAVSK